MITAAEVFGAARDSRPDLERGEVRVQPVPDLPTQDRVWLGYDAEGVPCGYFESSDHLSRGFSVSSVVLVDMAAVVPDGEDGAVATVKIRCADTALEPVFHSMIDVILARLGGERSPLEVIKTSVADWRSLLRAAESPMSEAAAAGLFGELDFLRQLVEVSGPEAIVTWQRSARDIHDFTGARARVEVKTSAFQTRGAVSVHGLRQLAQPVEATLTLAVAEVEKHSGQTIDELVEVVSAQGVPRDVLLEKLAAQGFVPGVGTAAEATFSVRSWRFWEIDSSSPVLSPATIPAQVVDAVSSVTYGLALSALGAPREAFDFERLAPVDEEVQE